MKRQGLKNNSISVLPNGERVVSVIRTGGYYRWDWVFPFRHFVKEQLRVFTEHGLYTIDGDMKADKYITRTSAKNKVLSVANDAQIYGNKKALHFQQEE